MSANNQFRGLRRRPGREGGVSAVEFSLLAIIFFTLVFGTIEVARLMFVYNTLHVVTRRVAQGAAHVYPLETARISTLKQAAIFRSSPGSLLLAPPVSDANIRIEYLALTRTGTTGALSLSPIDTSSLPPNAAQHRQLCMNNPNAANCVRLIEVRICRTPASHTCEPVVSTAILPLVSLGVRLHRATSIATAESLGYVGGTSP